LIQIAQLDVKPPILSYLPSGDEREVDRLNKGITNLVETFRNDHPSSWPPHRGFGPNFGWHVENLWHTSARGSAMPAHNSSSQLAPTACCIVGGGPAGMVLGFLLARAGVEALVLEKHADFLRDFRGDTIHPSTLELMYELGLLDDFLRRHHQELPQIGGVIDDFSVTIADFSHLPVHCQFVALMPQWDFLNFISESAKAYPQFHLRMESEVIDLIVENNRVAGVQAKTHDGVLEFRADLVIAADGRHSIVRQKAGFEVIDLGAPSMSSGCAFRARSVIPIKPSDVSAVENSSSHSTVTITGSAPT
jgi:2-polyprenyl-6-methoxyphenol hydroxylase-like FAD-dependent oxidoreductase